jgi:phosphoglycolate phosphatase-like HAD superfamily hydrolase
LFLAAADRFGADIASAIVVGDSIWDRTTALRRMAAPCFGGRTAGLATIKWELQWPRECWNGGASGYKWL